MSLGGGRSVVALMSLVDGRECLGDCGRQRRQLARLAECPTLAIVNIFSSHWQRSRTPGGGSQRAVHLSVAFPSLCAASPACLDQPLKAKRNCRRPLDAWRTPSSIAAPTMPALGARRRAALRSDSEDFRSSICPR